MTVNDIVISGHNYTLTAAMEELLRTKMERLLKHYGHFTTSIELLLRINNDDNIAEANVLVRDVSINASAKSDDMYKSIDDMIHKLKVQLEKYKETHLGHQKQQREVQNHKLEELTADELD